MGGSLCDIFPPAFECDTWAQDCPEGEKCMPWANDGGPHWNGTRCSPLDPNPGLAGDPCLVEGSQLSGIDNCALGHFCAWVDESNSGTCVAMCGGNEAQPLCNDPTTACVVDYLGAITLCLPTCDLLLQDCAAGEGACYVQAGISSTPTCGIQAATLAEVSEQCDYNWDCVPGTVCHPGNELANCAHDNCCTPICDSFQPPLTCGPGEECHPVIDEQAPGGPYPQGYCALP